jgi:DMSO/TMAO reductase YedYZ molybdopterin-dependent catalytic subunit
VPATAELFSRPAASASHGFSKRIGNSEWTGTPLRGILQDAGLSSAAVEIVFTGLDQGVEGEQIQFYQRSLTVDEAMRDEVLLVYEMNGEPLPPQHGYPLRLLMPGWYGMASVKWLDRIEAVAEAVSRLSNGSRLSLYAHSGWTR